MHLADLSEKWAKNEPTPESIIADLARCGVTLKTDGTRLWPEPKGLTAEVAAVLTARNDALIRQLGERPTRARAYVTKQD